MIARRHPIEITMAEYQAMTPQQRRRWREELLREWQLNRARELDEDERADAERGDWGT